MQAQKADNAYRPDYLKEQTFLTGISTNGSARIKSPMGLSLFLSSSAIEGKPSPSVKTDRKIRVRYRTTSPSRDKTPFPTPKVSQTVFIRAKLNQIQ